MRRLQSMLIASLVVLAACDGGDTPGMPFVPIGGGMMMMSPPAESTTPPAVETVLASNLGNPRDLAFNSRVTDELWVVNLAGSVTIVHQATAASPRPEVRRDRAYTHFMPNPSSLAFGADETASAAETLNPALAPGTFATCQESRNGGPGTTSGGNDFMGPVLWSSDLSVFAVKNGELGSHLDMLHQTPLCMGIAWAGSGNVFWVVNGLAGSIDRYDFQKDHGYGNDNHDDGLIHRFAPGKFAYAAGVPSHLVFKDDKLYVADAGNGRVARLSYEGARKGPNLVPKQDEAESYLMEAETLVDLVPRGQLERPSGIELHKDQLFVSDNASSDIVRFDLDGKLVRRYPTGLPAGSLAGLAFGPDAKLYFVDMKGNKVLRFDRAF